MEAIGKPRIKISGISGLDEALLATRYGAAALGLIEAPPNGSGVITESLIRQIVRNMPPGVSTFLVTSQRDPHAIAEQHQRCHTHTVELRAEMEAASYGVLRTRLPGVSLVQVVRVTGEGSLEVAQRVAPSVDALLLDAGEARSQVNSMISNRDWSLSRSIRQQVKIPIFLAGGLTPETVRDAAGRVGPYALDVNEGVRTKGQLDERKLASFFKQLNL